MSEQIDEQRALREQYKDASNLRARIQLHERFGQDKRHYQCRVFDHLSIPPDSAILELGCGPGVLWTSNQDRIPASWQVTLSDFSPGMLKEAEAQLAHAPHSFNFQRIDAQSIPFADGSLDAVIANHMLYHVPNKAQALSEIRRILKPTGKLFAVTNGQQHMSEVIALMQPFSVPGETPHTVIGLGSFTIENGVPQLERWFAHVDVVRFQDQLVVTETEPLLDYIASTYLRDQLTKEQWQELQTTIEQRITQDGALRITRVSALLVCWN